LKRKFSFQDFFLLQQIYLYPPDVGCNNKKLGNNQSEIPETRNASFIPPALKLPSIVGRIGIIKDEKQIISKIL